MRALITGGAGFIGCNAAKRYLDLGWNLTIVDDLSRVGSDKNLAWLRTQGDFTFHQCDIRDSKRVDDVFRDTKTFDAVLHLAAQVAVTTSVVNPRHDFEVNALGTFNVLEATRAFAPDAAFLYSSTNKVYGGLEHLKVVERNGRWDYADHAGGIAETESLDFHSPYGCSKGSADQYVRDYARIYGLRTVCLRQSCIYGRRQFGVEDQGWVAWFTIAAAMGRPISIYGDGKQVRDVLFVEDLLDCFSAAIERIDRVKGSVFNVGGGPRQVMSLHELIDMLERLSGRKIERRYEDWRPGDQRIFVCDVSKAERELGWKPRTTPQVGVETLFDWVEHNRELF
ncbi:MAG: GDP-mannose 4,6-dehydratase [Polyangiaceae bacterium]|jgi:CDP-paratose 2-epimerase